MSYYTNYTISTIPENAIEQVYELLEFKSDFELTFDSIEGCDLKWYDWEKNLLAISKRLPNIIIAVYGDGEESDDNWKAVICNNQFKTCQAELTYPDLDIQSIGDIGKRCPELFV